MRRGKIEITLGPFLPFGAAPSVFAVLEARVVGGESVSAARFLPI
jgi:hypothetical protein